MVRPGVSQVQSRRLFSNAFLEKFTHVHPITPILLWGPVVSVLLYRGFSGGQLGVAVVLAWVLGGILTWSLAEYLIHRFVFHFVARRLFLKRVVYLFHGIHHDQPDDPTRLVMPPIAGVLLAVFFFTLFRVFLGSVFVVPFFAGFLLGYLGYDYTHYYIHHFIPRTAVGKFLKAHHMKHHYMLKGAKWGVSSPLWDYTFRTMKER